MMCNSVSRRKSELGQWYLAAAGMGPSKKNSARERQRYIILTQRRSVLLISISSEVQARSMTTAQDINYLMRMHLQSLHVRT